MPARSKKCSKCGISRTVDGNVTYRKFPFPGKDTTDKAHAWAVYCWPEKKWTIETLSELHASNKVLCGRHFSASQFMDKKRQLLRKFAVPDVLPEVEESYILPTNEEDSYASILVYEGDSYTSSVDDVKSVPSPSMLDTLSSTSDYDMNPEYLSDWEALEESLEDLTDAEDKLDMIEYGSFHNYLTGEENAIAEVDEQSTLTTQYTIKSDNDEKPHEPTQEILKIENDDELFTRPQSPVKNNMKKFISKALRSIKTEIEEPITNTRTQKTLKKEIKRPITKTQKKVKKDIKRSITNTQKNTRSDTRLSKAFRKETQRPITKQLRSVKTDIIKQAITKAEVPILTEDQISNSETIKVEKVKNNRNKVCEQMNSDIPLSNDQVISSQKIAKTNELTVKKLPNVKEYGPCRCCLKEDEHKIINVQKTLRNLKIESPIEPQLPQLVCTACCEFLEEVDKFCTTVATSERMLLERLHRDKIDKDNEFGNATVKLKYVSDTGKVKGLTVPITNLSFNSSGEIVLGRIKNFKKNGFGKKIDKTRESENNLDEDTEAVMFEDINDNASPLPSTADTSVLPTEISPAGVDLQNECVVEDVSMADDEYDDNTDQVFQFNDLSNDTDYGITEPDYKDIRKPLTAADVFRIFKSPAGINKEFNTKRKICENLQTLIENSTIIPFTHNKNPTLSNNFECIYYDGNYSEFDDLRNHMEKKHAKHNKEYLRVFLKKLQESILRADTSFLKCKLCDEQVENIDQLVEHLVGEHNKSYNKVACEPPHSILEFDFSSKPMRCTVCEKEFAALKTLLVHMNQHFGTHLCEECGTKFMYGYAYKKHLFFHKVKRPQRPKTVICDACGEILKNKRELNLHKKTLHVKKEIKRDVTSLDATQFKSVLALPEELPICKLCSKDFKTVDELFVHRMQHLRASKEEVHTCELCGYITTRKGCLSEHLQRHWGIKNFICGVCNRGYVTSKALRFHALTHTARYKCPYCDTYFLNNGDFRSHIKNEHPEVNYRKFIRMKLKKYAL